VRAGSAERLRPLRTVAAGFLPHAIYTRPCRAFCCSVRAYSLLERRSALVENEELFSSEHPFAGELSAGRVQAREPLTG